MMSHVKFTIYIQFEFVYCCGVLQFPLRISPYYQYCSGALCRLHTIIDTTRQ